MNATERYRIERHRGGWFRRWRVMVGTSTWPVYVGTRMQCLRVQQALWTAFNDGAWAAEHHK